MDCFKYRMGLGYVLMVLAFAPPSFGDVPAGAKMEIEVDQARELLDVERATLEILFKEKEEEKWYRILIDGEAKRAGLRRARRVGDITCPSGLAMSVGGITPADDFIVRVAGRSFRSQYRAVNRSVAGEDGGPLAGEMAKKRMTCARLREYRARTEPADRLDGRKLHVELNRAARKPRCAVDERTGRYCFDAVPLLLSMTGGERGERLARRCGRVGIENWWGGSARAPQLYEFELRLEEELAFDTGSPGHKSVGEITLRLGPPSDSVMPGDRDADGDVDADDLWKGKEIYAGCYTGPDQGPITAGCLALDMDDDNDCDGHDWTLFRAAWTGPDPPPDAIPPGRDAYELMIVIVIIGGESPIPPIPAGFFGPGSDPFSSIIELIGADPNRSGGGATAVAPCVREELLKMNRKDWAELPGPTPVSIELKQLNLVSKEPIRVTYDGGAREELYTMTMTITDENPSMGQMMIRESPVEGELLVDMTGAGGTGLDIYPRFKFIPLGGGEVKEMMQESPVRATAQEEEEYKKEIEEGVLTCGEEARFYAKKERPIQMLLDGGASGMMTLTAVAEQVACCLPGGECVEGLDDDCDAMGGTYQGYGMSCYPSPCQPLWGACCYGDPVPHLCTVTTHANCDLLTGTWHGGYDCRDVCPKNGVADTCDTTPPCAICCMVDGTCEKIEKEAYAAIKEIDECAAMGGLPMSGDSCDPNPCPPAQGGCCMGEACTEGQDNDCNAMGGQYQGDGTGCYPNPCDPAEAACCYGDPPHACVMTDENDCTSTYGGAWHAGYDCRDQCPLNGIPDVCDTTAPQCAVCCLPGGACVEREYADCMAMGGEPKPTLGCAPYTCEGPQGGCCSRSGMCEERKEEECDSGGGIYQGPGSSCGGGSCYAFETACCLRSGECINTTYDACVRLLGGDPQGPGTNCFQPMVACQPLKWAQPPTYNISSPNEECFWGWDEMSHYDCCKIMADDWMCTTDKPISDIHWWGSYIGWIDPVPPGPPDAPRLFRIGIWKDVPVSAAPNCCRCWMDFIPLRACDMGEFDMQYCLEVLGVGWDHCEWHPDAYCQADFTCKQAFSHPGELIREWIVPRTELNERWVGCDFHPEHPSPDACFRYDFKIPYGESFYQIPGGDPTIYWVSIAAWYEGIPPGVHPWGWKTREHFFNDDAVAIVEPRAPLPGDQYLSGYPLVTPDGFSWDMAFVLTTPATEACCFVDGRCEDKIPQECENIDGIPQGAGTRCGLPEACCLEDGTCIMVDPLCCDDMGGKVQEAGSACSDHQEACCLEDGSCVMVDPLCCDDMGGILLEPGSVCTGEIQACCLPDTGVCVMADPTCCDMLMGGAPQGPDSQCTVPEACCFEDGSCINVDPVCCDDLGGIPQGHWTECTWTQACCIIDDTSGGATCIDVDPYCCDEMGGTPQGIETGCVDMIRSCCLDDGTCVMVDPICCDDLGGEPSPSGEPVCLGDVNGNGTDDACEWPPAKWVQIPDLTRNGIDIQLGPEAQASRVLADDFPCTQPGLITDVHLWGSWKYDIIGALNLINLSIWSDDPVGPGGSDPNNIYSHPDVMLWTRDFSPAEFTMTLYHTLVDDPGEWWWDPYPDPEEELIPGGDTQVWRVDIKIDPAEAFRQGGSPQDPLIYWLAVRVENGMWGEFGWKTRRWRDHYNDDAVWDYGSELPRFWRELRYPPGHPYHGLEDDSIDLAFALTTKLPDPPTPPTGEPGYKKIRYISFVPANPGMLTALRVTLTDMPAPFDAFDGEQMWVGEAVTKCENAGQHTPPAGGCGPAPGLPLNFRTANLQCAPYCMDYGAVGALHVTDDEIVPLGVYDVQAIDCSMDFGVEANYSAPLTIRTSKWGDLVKDCTVIPCGPPDGNVNITTDVTSVLDKFKNLPGAVMKSRADIEPNKVEWLVNITDVTQCLDAFLGRTYPPFGWPGPGGCPFMGPRIASYGDSGCKGAPADDYPYCGDDEFELMVPGPGMLHVDHRNATYNCCPDDIRISLSAEGSNLMFTEEEVLTVPCFCLCCYDVEATVVGLLPGTYTASFCWYDYESNTEVCRLLGEVVIP